jgi:hypothetical protein
MQKFKKYSQNLSLVNYDGQTFVKSYDTHVARIDGANLIQLGWWSVTTQKHINYAANELKLNLIRSVN